MGCGLHHEVCVKCFAAQMASAGCDNHIACPCSTCNVMTKSYVVNTATFNHNGDVDHERCTFTNEDPDKEMDPIRYFREKSLHPNFSRLD